MPYNPPSDGDVLTATLALNDIWNQVIAQVTSASRPTGTEGQVIYETDTGRFYAHNGTTWVQFAGLASSATNLWTPQLDQGATTIFAKTVNYSQYQIMGNLCWWSFSITVNASGTAGSNFTLTTPVTMSATTPGLGAGRIWDNSAPFAYHGIFIPALTTNMRLFVDTNISNSAWGVAPNLAVAANDAIWGSVILPIA